MKPATCVPSATIHCNGCAFWIGVHGSLEPTRCGARGTGNGPHTLRAGVLRQHSAIHSHPQPHGASRDP